MGNQTEYSSPEVITFGESMGLFTAQDTRGLEYASTLSKSFGGAESNVRLVWRDWVTVQAGLEGWVTMRWAR